MNDSLLLMAAMGGRIDSATLRAHVAEQNIKRKKIYVRLAEILFTAACFIWGGLKFEAKDAAGKVIDKADLTPEAKLDLLLAGQETTQKGQLFREFLRPLIIAAAEFLADAMAPNEMMLALVSGSPVNLPGLPPVMAAFGNSAVGAPAGMGFNPGQYEGKFLHSSDVNDGTVFMIQGGYKRSVGSPAILNKYGKGLSVENGRWSGVDYVPMSIIDRFPTGSPLT